MKCPPVPVKAHGGKRNPHQHIAPKESVKEPQRAVEECPREAVNQNVSRRKAERVAVFDGKRLRDEENGGQQFGKKQYLEYVKRLAFQGFYLLVCRRIRSEKEKT